MASNGRGSGGSRFAEHGRHEEALAVVPRRRLQRLGGGERGSGLVGAEDVLGVERVGERRHRRRVDLGQLRHQPHDLREFARHASEFILGQGQPRERRDLGDFLPGE
jgi:hypothetical protein